MNIGLFVIALTHVIVIKFFENILAFYPISNLIEKIFVLDHH